MDPMSTRHDMEMKCRENYERGNQLDEDITSNCRYRSDIENMVFYDSLPYQPSLSGMIDAVLGVGDATDRKVY